MTDEDPIRMALTREAQRQEPGTYRVVMHSDKRRYFSEPFESTMHPETIVVFAEREKPHLTSLEKQDEDGEWEIV